MRRLSAFSPPEGQHIPTQSSADNNINNDNFPPNELTFNNNTNTGNRNYVGGGHVNINRELLNIAVEIGEGKSANILIRERDDPYQVSYEFA